MACPYERENYWQEMCSRSSEVRWAPLKGHPGFERNRAPLDAANWADACCAKIGSGVGGARRDRTDDLLLAKQALSQLSYGPGRRSPTEARSQNPERL